MLYYMDPNDFLADSDSAAIQLAVDEAARTGCNRVVIPNFNKRTGQYLWVIDRTILLPSNIDVEINNAHLRMADGVMCRMFENANAVTDIGKTPEGEQENIVIRGVGNALLDGGKHNGLREDTAGKNGMPMVFNNLTIYLHNVKNFRIQGLRIRDQRWWAICCAWSWDGVIKDLHFEITDKSVRKSSPRFAEHPWRNQDGVDLRLGCHDIQIHNLTGETCDDVVALTALGFRGSPRFEDLWRCEHMSPDIRNVSIRNITAFNNHCAIIRLLCNFRNRVYNVCIDNVIDASPREASFTVNEGIRSAVCVKVGESAYHKGNPEMLCQPGEMRDITISNVFSSAYCGVVLNSSVKNITVRNLHVTEEGRYALAAARVAGGKCTALEDPENTTRAQNILVDGVHFAGRREGAVPFLFDALQAKNFRIRNVSYEGGQLTEVRRPQEETEEVIFENVRCEK